jgi:two-component system nitrate/nitrite response regulator NarL
MSAAEGLEGHMAACAAGDATSRGEGSGAEGAGPCSVVVADDHARYRDGLVRTFDRSSELEVVGTATDGMQAVRVVRQLRPQLLVVDVRMPVLDGLQVAELLAVDDELRQTRVALMSAEGGTTLEDAARHVGAVLLDKTWPRARIREAVLELAVASRQDVGR